MEELEPRAEYKAYRKALLVLSALTPEQRATVIEWIGDAYCLDCGYPAPPYGGICEVCRAYGLKHFVIK